MIETIAGMVDLAPTATPAQLEELVALLESDRSTLSEPALASPPALTQSPLPESSASSVASLPPPVGQPLQSAPSEASVASSPPAAPPTSSDTSVASLPPPASDAAGASEPPPVTQPAPPASSDASVASSPPAANTSRTASLPTMSSNPSSSTVSAAPAQAPSYQKPAEDDAVARAAVLFNRGQAAEAEGNISGARRFYGSAAERGNAAAARSLGRLYDFAYLRGKAIGGVDPDPVLARSWYERAVKMGDPSAGSLLSALSTR